MEDITPELLKKITNEFNNSFKTDRQILEYLKLLKSGSATYIEANKFSILVGKLLANVLKNNISSAILPDGKFYFNIANRVLNSTLKKNYDLVTNYSGGVQRSLNKKANLHIKFQKPKINQERISGIINRVASEEIFDDVSWILEEPIVNFTQNIVSETIEKNVKFHSSLGLKPVVRRQVVGDACEWCRAIAGTYLYPQEVPEDFYGRHERCRCMNDYLPGDGRKQDVWSKKFK